MNENMWGKEEEEEEEPLGPVYLYIQAHFTLGVRADVQPKSSIPIGSKVEIGPKAGRKGYH